MRMMRLLFAVLLVGAGSNNAFGQEIQVDDDSFKPFIAFSSPQESDGPSAEIRYLTRLDGTVDRRTKARKFVLDFYATYSDRGWHEYSRAALDGGQPLKLISRDANRGRCFSGGQCLFSEDLRFEIPESLLRSAAAKDLSIKIFAKSGDSYVYTLKSGLAGNLLQSMAKYSGLQNR